MKSKAHIKSHPIHPMLVGFPIAFFIGTFLFDVLELCSDENSFEIVAGYLNIAGIIAAVITAVPGIVDFFGTVPPKSSAKKRAAQHGIINTTVLVLFAIVFYLRGDTNLLVVLFIELVALVLLTIAGWMGGTLVYRNHIGVYNRYANAGNWNEDYIKYEQGRIQVATADELKIDQMKLLHLDEKRIVLGRTEQGHVAFDDHCTHRGGSLAGGVMICGTVQCPWHGSQFDCKTGAVKAGPAGEAIKTYTVEEKDGKVYLIM